MEQIETNSKLADLNSAEYIVKLNRNKLNIQIKRHRLWNEKKMQEPPIVLSLRNSLKRQRWLKVKGWKMTYHVDIIRDLPKRTVNTYPPKDLYANVNRSFIMVKKWKEPKYLSTTECINSL